MSKILMFTQPGCISCELTKTLLEAMGVAFEERDIIADREACREMVDVYDSRETPTLVIFDGDEQHVITGFDPDLLDQLFSSAPSSDSKEASNC